MTANIAKKLPARAKEFKERIAVTAPINGKPSQGNIFKYESLSFEELETKSNTYAKELLNLGFQKGDRVLMFVRPSIEFSALTFAVFRAGLVPIFIDPGMGRKNLLAAVEQIKPVGLIAEPEVHFLRLIFRKPFQSVRHFVTTGKLTWGRMKSIQKWKGSPSADTIMADVKPEDTAAILFTSGGTGIPKGVRYTHQIFNSQVEKLQEMFNLNEEEVDLPGFPLFSLFTITMGMKSAIPAMNPSKPSQCNPEWLVQNIRDHKATFVAGSPAIWERVANYCIKNTIQLPSVKYLVMFGAPVSILLHEKFQKILTNGDTYTPYGATECLPVSNTQGSFILNTAREKMLAGKGTCVGVPAPNTIIKIAPITDSPLLSEEDFSWQEPNTLGEICVYSETVTPEYVGMPQKTKEAKIKASENGLWHRMGDLGYIDENGLLWFCGRKSHRVHFEGKVIPSLPQETLFLGHPLIRKCAFVGPTLREATSPSLVIEPSKKLSKIEKEALKEEILKLAKDIIPGTPLEQVFFHSPFPVDVRHNIKIDRLKIKESIEKGIIQ
jgi:acyl-CoA synthetase (AMP-forming)/AMP-acid ligase II